MTILYSIRSHRFQILRRALRTRKPDSALQPLSRAQAQGVKTTRARAARWIGQPLREGNNHPQETYTPRLLIEEMKRCYQHQQARPPFCGGVSPKAGCVTASPAAEVLSSEMSEKSRSIEATSSAAAGDTVDVNCFRTFGFLVLRQFFDPLPLAAEIDRALHDGPVSSADVSRHDAINFQYVPMMTANTPVSLWLLDRTEVVAATLLGTSVLPTRAKAVRYSGNTPWHVDSVFPVASVGFAAYLEPLRAENGGLRVLPGSHRPELGDAIRALGGIGVPATALPSHVIATEPGDMIIFDEHLFHASFGGATRRQWRIDYISDPTSAEAESRTIAYFASIYPPDWDGGYDVDRYPSYGPDWRASGRPAVARLEALGVYEFAARQEAFARTKRRASG